MQIKRIIKSNYIGNLSIQLVGTFIAQIIPIVISPILSRLYKEEAFATLTLFMAIIGVLAVPNAGRYNIAIVRAKDEKEAEELYQISIIITILYNLLLLLLIFILYSYLNKHYKLDLLWYFIPFGVFLFGVYNTGLFYYIQKKLFIKNVKAKIVQTIISSIISIGIIYLGFRLYGLVIGRILGLLTSAFMLFRFFKIKFNYETFKETLLKYIDYPKLTIVPTIMNIFSLQALVLYVGLYYSESDLGFLGLANMVLVAPIALIGTSYRDVFYQKVTELFNKKKILKAKSFFLISALTLFVLAILLSCIMFFGGEFLFSFVYGDTWKKSGTYASILVFATAIKLVVSPLSVVLNTTGRLKWLSLWQISYFISLNLTLYLSISKLELSIKEVFVVYAVHETIMYALYFMLQYISISYSKK